MNTGSGWQTWNTDGQFVTWYVEDSVDHGVVPVFTYYMLLQSSPATGGDEAAKDLSNLRNTATMAAWWADLRVFFQRAATSTPVVLHVEPDLWGYIEQAASGDDAAHRARRGGLVGVRRRGRLREHRGRLRARRSSTCVTPTPRT